MLLFANDAESLCMRISSLALTVVKSIGILLASNFRRFVSFCSNQVKGKVTLLGKQMELYASLLLQNERKRIELAESKLESAHPNRILRLGFSITRVDGKAVRSVDEVKEGDEIETTLASGTFKSTITWKQK